MVEPSMIGILIVGIGREPVTFLEQLIHELSKHDFRITVAIDRRSFKKRFDYKKVHWLWLPFWDGSILLRIVKLLALLIVKLPSKRLPWLFRHVGSQVSFRSRLLELHRLLPFTQGNWDVIYFPWNSAAIDYEAIFDLEIPAIVSCRGSQVNIAPHNPYRKQFVEGLRQTFRKAAAVHGVSKEILEEAKSLGLEPSKGRVIHPAVDADFFTPSTARTVNNRFTVLSTGSLIWRKGYEYALMAIRFLIDRAVDVDYHIIGDGQERQRVLYTIQDLGLEKHVILHGYLAPNEVRGCLRGADAFLLASLSEGISNAVLEAMSCGLPVVTTDCGGMRDAITDGVEGFVVPPRNPQAMADVLAELHQNADLRLRMGQLGRKRVIRDFNLQDQTNKFIDLLKDII